MQTRQRPRLPIVWTALSLMLFASPNVAVAEDLPDCTDTALKAATLRQLFDGARAPEQPGGAEMTKSMALFALGNFLIALVLAHSIEAWQPSTWNYGPDGSPAGYALNAAIWTWIGFFVPLQIGRVAWEKKKWGLVLINSSFDLVRLLVFGFILAYWQ